MSIISSGSERRVEEEQEKGIWWVLEGLGYGPSLAEFASGPFENPSCGLGAISVLRDDLMN